MSVSKFCFVFLLDHKVSMKASVKRLQRLEKILDEIFLIVHKSGRRGVLVSNGMLSWMSVTFWEQFRYYFLFRSKPTRRSRRTKVERTTDPKTKGLVRKCMSKPFFSQQYAQATCNLSARSDGLYMSSPGNDDDPSSLSRKKVFFICSFFIVLVHVSVFVEMLILMFFSV